MCLLLVRHSRVRSAPSRACVQMKGKNKPTRRQKKKQENIIMEKRPQIKAHAREEVSSRRSMQAGEDSQPATLARSPPRGGAGCAGD